MTVNGLNSGFTYHIGILVSHTVFVLARNIALKFCF